MTWIHEIDTWIVVTGILCALPCALLGVFLLLRQQSMMGDAISHAVLPGLVIAFMVTGSRASIPMFVGAAVVGLLTAVFTQWIATFGQVDRSAAMGIVFTSLFAVGLILIVRVADQQHIDLDPGCVLYGAIEFTPLDTVPLSAFTPLNHGGWAEFEVPRAVLTLLPILVIDALIILVLYKEFKICAFDPALATTLGINARFMHYLLMAMVAVTTVACFESIGSILVIAMLIVPAAAAHLLTDRLLPMIAVALLFGVAAAVLGHVAALMVPIVLEGVPLFGRAPETSTAGMMATVAGVLFVAVMLLAPQHGVLGRLLQRWRVTATILHEDTLGLLYRLEEATQRRGDGLSTIEIAEALRIARWRARVVGRRLLGSGCGVRSSGQLALTSDGRRRAARLVRTHRLWEIFLHKRLAVAADHVHGTAHRMEHVTRGALLEQLEREADGTRDPHGRDLPPNETTTTEAPDAHGHG